MNANGNGAFPGADTASDQAGRLESRPSGRIIDLTLTLRPGMRGVAFEPKFNFKEHGWNAQTLHLYSHCGTHMDAPVHSEAGDQTIDEIPLAQCMGPAWLVKLDGISPKALITVADLGDIARRFAPGDSLILRTGWSAFVDQSKWRDELPRISLELARWCVAKRVKLLGVEPPSVADVNHLPEVIQIHQTLLGGGVLIVEGLTNLEAITQEKVFFAALPLKPLRGDGSPVRAFAIEDGSGGILAAKSAGENRQHGGRDAADPVAAAPADPFAKLVFLDHKEVTAHTNRLPHWHQDGATYFVTFRLADSLPEELLAQWQAEREVWMRLNPPPWNEEQETEYQKRFPGRIEDWLDEGRGACVLRQAECREIVAAALRHFHGERHTLFASAIMPNHVHVLFSLLGEHRLEDVLHTWKSFTATEINRHLGQAGALWMKDYFDRSIRNREHFAKVARYIRRNPERAKLRAGEFTLWEGDLVADVLDRKGGWGGLRSGGIPAAGKDKAGNGSGVKDVAPPSVIGGRDAAAPEA